MEKRNIFERVTTGLRQTPLNFVVNVFIVYSVAWAVLEPLLGLIPSASTYFSGIYRFAVLLFLSLIVGLYRNAVPNEIKIKHDNSLIKVLFGDIFLLDGFISIPISRYFLETDVIPASLQGQLIQRFEDSKGVHAGLEFYQESVLNALSGVQFQEVFRGETQQYEKYYPLGTTVSVELDGQDYLLFALTETELKGYASTRENCNTQKMWAALEPFWKAAKANSMGKSINIPLFGSGVVGIELSPSRLLELNLLSAVDTIERFGSITLKEIRIVLHPKYMNEINLRDFKKIWY